MDNTDIKIAMIAGMGSNRVIGANNKLPWDIKKDMNWFRDKTRGKPCIMGRRTYESILSIRNAPLPNRTSIVLTRQDDYDAGAFDDVRVVSKIKKAIEVAKIQAAQKNLKEVCIIGGEEVYKLGLPLADRLYLTHIEKKYEGDSFFPEFDENEWDVSFEKYHEAENDSPALNFKIYDREV